MKEVTFTFRYTGDAETWDEIREDAEQGKIKSVFIGKKEFVNAELIAELEAQLPKEGEWLDEQRGRWIYAKCNLCGKVQDVRSNYCPNCGAKMDGETEHGNTYSLGKIEMPKGAMKKIIADGERKDGEE